MTAGPKPVDHSKYDVIHSPFIEIQTPFNAWEKFKMALLIVLVIPRCLIAVLSLCIMACFSYAAIAGCPTDQPLPPFRRKIVLASRHCVGVLLLCLGFWPKVRGYENIKKGQEVGALGLFNHISYVDSLAMFWLSAPSGVSKAANAEIPLIGACVKSFQNIYVPRGTIDRKATTPGDRNTPASGTPNGTPRNGIAQMIGDRVKDRRYPMVVMAPEGTCGNGRCLLKFRTGAFVSGAPVLPFLLSYAKKHHNPAWTIINEPWHFLRLMCQFYNSLDVLILPPYMPSEEEKKNPSLYAENVRKLYAKHLNLPLVEESQTEFKALEKAGVTVSWDDSRVIAPKGIINEATGIADLTLADKKGD